MLLAVVKPPTKTNAESSILPVLNIIRFGRSQREKTPKFEPRWSLQARRTNRSSPAGYYPDFLRWNIASLLRVGSCLCTSDSIAAFLLFQNNVKVDKN